MAQPLAVQPSAPPSLVRSLIGQKVIMATSGVILFLFVVGHLLGNLKVFQGPEHFNAYAEGLRTVGAPFFARSEEHTSELQSQSNLVCRLLLEKKKKRMSSLPIPL